jgi:hypothetical protein
MPAMTRISFSQQEKKELIFKEMESVFKLPSLNLINSEFTKTRSKKTVSGL